MNEKTAIRNQKRKEVVEAIAVRGELIGTVSRVFNVPIRTIFDWLALYRSGGWHRLNEMQKSGRKRKLTGAQMKWVYDVVTGGDPRQYCFEIFLWSLKTLNAVIYKELGIKLSKSALSRLLKHMGISPQRPIYKSYKQSNEKIEEYLKNGFPEALEKAKKIGAKIYFIDEAAVRSDAHRGVTWGKIGETPVVKNSGSRFGIRLISAISPRGDMWFACIEEQMNSEVFINFLKSLRHDAGQPILVIADNASYHKSKETCEFLDTVKDQIIMAYLPPYTPELNPDEQVWNHAKRIIAETPIKNKTDMKEKALSILKSLKENFELIKSFFMLKDTKYVLSACF